MSSFWGPMPSKIIRGNSRVYTGKVNKPDMRRLTDTNTGKDYEVPEDDYKDYIGRKQDQSIGDYVSAAFDPSNQPIVQPVGNMSDSVGHILMLEYSPMYKVLRVTFRNKGRVVAYMNVPSSVAGELLHLAQSNNTAISSIDKKLRHVVGMRFWDLIRIRGHVHESRYPFEYVQAGGESGTSQVSKPDWNKTQFVFVDDGSGELEAVPVNQLSDVEKKRLDDRVTLSGMRTHKNVHTTIDNMYKHINSAPIEDGPRQSVLSAMDAINKGKGSTEDKTLTMYNYLSNMGLL
ncbi:MAG: hypothetical protein IKQ22_00675 [Clostridia bacterium]|nr:hypothetical protein [Clostridia bacterium]